MTDHLSRYQTYDEAMVDRLTRGVAPPSKPSFGDRREAIRRMAASGLSDSQIAERFPVPITQRTVLRYRSRFGIKGLPRGLCGQTRPVDPCLTGKHNDRANAGKTLA